jgi:hypothetical protein
MMRKKRERKEKDSYSSIRLQGDSSHHTVRLGIKLKEKYSPFETSIKLNK